MVAVELISMGTRPLIGSLLLHFLLLCFLIAVFGEAQENKLPPSPELEVRSVKLRTRGPARKAEPAPLERPLPTRAQAVTQPAAKPAAAVEKKSPRAPQKVALPKPSYPVRIATKRAKSGGSGPLPKDSPAVPTYHPAVTLTDAYYIDSILVRFYIEPDSRFEVEILQGTGDGVLDARTVVALKRWKWMPKREGGQYVSSIETVRLWRVESRSPGVLEPEMLPQ